MNFQQQDLKQLLSLPKQIEAVRMKLQRLRDQAGMHSVSLDGMPRGSGVKDRVGELAAAIVDAEEELQRLTEDYEQIRARAADWIDGLGSDDVEASLILGLRYLDQWGWDQIGSECRMEPDAARKICTRFLKTYWL